MAPKRKVHHRESIQKKFGGKTDIFKRYRGKNPFTKPHFWYFAVAFVLSLLLGLFISSPAPRFSLALSDWRDAGYLYRHGEFDIFYQDVYQMKASGRGPPLLILHGFPTSSYDWKKMIYLLTNRFGRIVAVDMLGFGFSHKPENYNYTVLEQALIHEEILKSHGINNVHLLAHDLGDTVAQEMVARYLDRKSKGEEGLNISSLCLTNGGILPGTDRPRFAQKLLRTPIIGDVAAMLMNYLMFSVSFSEIFGYQSKPTWSEMWDFWTIIRYRNGHLAGPRLLKYIDERVQHRDRWVGGLQKTEIPLHYIYGARDPVNPEEALQLYRKLIPQSSVSVLPEAGHYPQWEAPKEFLTSYYGFLDRIGVKQTNS